MFFDVNENHSIIVDASNGSKISCAVYDYQSWNIGKYCKPAKNQFRQHPLDYVEGLEITIYKAITEAPLKTAKKIKNARILIPEIFYSW